jgi:AraC-like DNA-binding protein
VSRVAVFHTRETPESIAGVLAGKGRISVPLEPEEAHGLELAAERTLREFGGALTLQGQVWYEKIRAELCWLALRGIQDPVAEGPRPRALWAVEDACRIYRERVLENPSVEQVSREVGISPSHLRRLFHQVRGYSPRMVFRRIRLETARGLVLGGDRNVSEIADEWGFSEPGAFSRAYRSAFGVSPRRDREIRRLGGSGGKS